MGTRADFYVGRGLTAEWLGSTAWDGYPSGFDADLFQHTSESSWRDAVKTLLASRKDGTVPEKGWPWPWEDSQTTDYAYAFDGDKVWASCFGGAWFDPNLPEPDEDDEGPEGYRKVAVFPNMRSRQKVTFGERSGIKIFLVPKDGA